MCDMFKYVKVRILHSGAWGYPQRADELGNQGPFIYLFIRCYGRKLNTLLLDGIIVWINKKTTKWMLHR